ncbi:MAG TPA: hypothetical protein VJR89_00385 [Polyangiales bacterium]|nr:hypothetical protein [Polyangiales bacterium]
MWIVSAFWILLALPGLACLCRLDPSRLDDGALAVVARSYLLSLGLLTPISVLGYVLHWPLAVLSSAYLLLVLAGVWLLARDRSWLRAFAGPSVIALLGAAWLAFELWTAVRAGSHVAGDAGFHIARIRMLLELGMGSWDPLVAGRQFEPIYHTNLYHALIAVSAQLARVDPVAAWIWVWPFTKLMLAAAAYELALRVLGERWPAWLAAIAAGSWFATQSALPYPNTLAPFVFLPLGVAIVIAAAAEAPSFRNAAWVAMAAVALAELHALYALFLLLTAAPLLAACAGWAILRRGPARSERTAAVLALALCVPWLVVPAWPRVAGLFGSVAHAQAAPEAVQLTSKQRQESIYVAAGGERVYMDPRAFWPDSQATYALTALLLAAALTRRRSVFAALCVLATLAVYFFVPAVCSLLVKLAGAGWILVRFTNLLEAMGMTLAPAGAALAALCAGRALAPWLPGARALLPLTLGVLQLVAAGLALRYGEYFGPRAEPWSTASIRSAARAKAAVSKAARATARAEFFAEHVAAESTLLAPLLMDYQLPMHCVCRGFAFRGGRGKRNLPDIEARRVAADRFYAHDASAEERRAIVDRYQLRYIYSSPRRVRRLAADFGSRVRNVSSAGEDAVIELGP